MRDSVLVLLHGGPGMSPECFDDVCLAFQDKIQVVRVHSGLSGDYSIDGLVKEVSTVLATCAGKNIYLVGHSFGGALALETLKRTKIDLAGLCLVSWIYNKDFLTAFMANHADYKEPQIEAGLPPDEAMKQTVIADVDLYFGPDAREQGIRVLSNMAYNSALSSEIYPNYLMAFDSTDVLPALEMPVLSISGGKDRVVAHDYLKKGEDFISRCTARCYENSGHFPFVDARERFVGDLRGFIRKGEV